MEMLGILPWFLMQLFVDSSWFTNSMRVIYIVPPNGRQGHITKQSSVCFPVSVGRQEHKCFSWRRKVLVDNSSFSSISCLFHVRSVATDMGHVCIYRCQQMHIRLKTD